MEAAEAVEALEALEAVEALEAAEAVESVEVVARSLPLRPRVRPRLKMAGETCGFLGRLSWAWDAIADVAVRPIGLRPIDGATGAAAGAAAAAEALAGATAGAVAGAKKAANDEAKDAPLRILD